MVMKRTIVVVGSEYNRMRRRGLWGRQQHVWKGVISSVKNGR